MDKSRGTGTIGSLETAKPCSLIKSEKGLDISRTSFLEEHHSAYLKYIPKTKFSIVSALSKNGMKNNFVIFLSIIMKRQKLVSINLSIDWSLENFFHFDIC